MAHLEPYQTLIGDRWLSLPLGVRASHSVPITASGLLAVSRAERGIAGMIARAMGLPSSGLRVPVTVRTKWQGNRILWTRDFNGKLLLTTQRIEENLIVERQGPFSLHLSMRATDASLKLRRVGLRFLGIPIPMVFGPHVLARVSAGSSEGAWKVDVKSIHFGYGFVGRYRGEMNSH